MKSITNTAALAIGLSVLLAPTTGNAQGTAHGLKCPSLDINFEGARFGDRISIDPSPEFLEGLVPQSDLDRKLSELGFSFFAQFSSCKRGEGSTLVQCAIGGARATLSFLYVEKVEATEFHQSVRIGRQVNIKNLDLKVVTVPGVESFSNKPITVAKLVIDGVLESSEGTKNVHHEQRVGEWLNPIPSNRSDYGLCVFR